MFSLCSHFPLVVPHWVFAVDIYTSIKAMCLAGWCLWLYTTLHSASLFACPRISTCLDRPARRPLCEDIKDGREAATFVMFVPSQVLSPTISVRLAVMSFENLYPCIDKTATSTLLTFVSAGMAPLCPLPPHRGPLRRAVGRIPRSSLAVFLPLSRQNRRILDDLVSRSLPIMFPTPIRRTRSSLSILPMDSTHSMISTLTLSLLIPSLPHSLAGMGAAA